MSLIVNHNLAALNATNTLNATYTKLQKSIQRLSSGLRINSSMDDAAGLAVREIMRSDIRVLDQGIRNAQDAINMLKTADGAMSVVDEKLIRMKELAEQAATGTYTTAQRLIMNDEFQAMAEEITRIANATNFNGIKLLDGSMSALHRSETGEGQGVKIHFGTGNNSAEDYYYVQLNDMQWNALQGGYEYGNYLINTHTQSDTATAMSATGYFSFYYNNNGNTNQTEVADIFAVMSVSAGDTLSTVATTINRGTAARVALTFGSTIASGQYVTIGSQTYEFVGASGDAQNFASAISMIIGASYVTGAAAMTKLMSTVNADTSGSAWLIMSTANTNNGVLFARTNGTAGNGLLADVITVTTSTVSGATQTISTLTGSNLGDAGQFAFYYDANSAGGSMDLADLFGVIDVSVAGDLSQIAEAVNNGTAARAVLAFGSTVMSNWTVSIGNLAFQFVSQASDAVAGFSAIVMGNSTMAASAAMSALMTAIKTSFASLANFWAIMSGTGQEDMYIFAKTTGSDGNDLVVHASGASTLITLNSTDISATSTIALSGGGSTWATASIVAGSAAGSLGTTGYVLRLTGEASTTALNIANAASAENLSGIQSAIAILTSANAWSSAFNTSRSTDSISMVGGGSDWLAASAYLSTTAAGSTTYQLRVWGQYHSTYADSLTYGLSTADMGSGVFARAGGFGSGGTILDQSDDGSNNWTTSSNANLLTQSSAQAALAILDAAIVSKDTARAQAGATANRLENTVTAQTIQAENLQASESQISDADVAQEMTEFTRQMILAQSGVAMLAQANSIANLALQLLGG